MRIPGRRQMEVENSPRLPHGGRMRRRGKARARVRGAHSTSDSCATVRSSSFAQQAPSPDHRIGLPAKSTGSRSPQCARCHRCLPTVDLLDVALAVSLHLPDAFQTHTTLLHPPFDRGCRRPARVPQLTSRSRSHRDADRPHPLARR